MTSLIIVETWGQVRPLRLDRCRKSLFCFIELVIIVLDIERTTLDAEQQQRHAILHGHQLCNQFMDVDMLQSRAAKKALVPFDIRTRVSNAISKWPINRLRANMCIVTYNVLLLECVSVSVHAC